MSERLCASHTTEQIYVCIRLDGSCYLVEYKRANISETDNTPCGGNSTKASTSVTEDQCANFSPGEKQLNDNVSHIKPLQ